MLLRPNVWWNKIEKNLSIICTTNANDYMIVSQLHIHMWQKNDYINKINLLVKLLEDSQFWQIKTMRKSVPSF